MSTHTNKLLNRMPGMIFMSVVIILILMTQSATGSDITVIINDTRVVPGETVNVTPGESLTISYIVSGAGCADLVTEKTFHPIKSINPFSPLPISDWKVISRDAGDAQWNNGGFRSGCFDNDYRTSTTYIVPDTEATYVMDVRLGGFDGVNEKHSIILRVGDGSSIVHPINVTIVNGAMVVVLLSIMICLYRFGGIGDVMRKLS